MWNNLKLKYQSLGNNVLYYTDYKARHDPQYASKIIIISLFEQGQCTIKH